MSHRHGKNDHGGKPEPEVDEGEREMREKVIEKIIDNKQDINKTADDVERLVEKEMREIKSEMRKHHD